MNFLGREGSFRQLEQLWDKKAASLVAITGRRRIGKSRLVQEFSKTAKTWIEIQGLAPSEGNSNELQLKHFMDQLSAQLSIPGLKAESWYQAFWLLDQQIPSTGKVLVFLDELSWMGKYDPAFPGTLKTCWDTLFKKHDRLILVVCGSVSSWIQANVIHATDFLGRLSLTLNLEELPLSVLPKFWGRYQADTSPREMAQILSVTGGVPRYLEEVNFSKSAEQNIKRLCFERNGILVEEFDRIFKDIFEEKHLTYKKIVSQLVHGKKSFAQICKALKTDRNGTFSKYLDELTLAGFLSRDFNYQNGKPTKLSYYRIKDNYLRFYLRYIEPQKDKINKNLFQNKNILLLPEWNTIMGLQFENLVLNNLPLLLKKLEIDPGIILSAAPYFQTKTQKNKGSCQIDLLIETKDQIFYLCEIKTGKKIGKEAVEEIQRKASLLKRPKYSSLRKVLIFLGELEPSLVESEGFYQIIGFEELTGTPRELG